MSLLRGLAGGVRGAEMRPGRRLTLRLGLIWSMVLLASAYLAALAVHGAGWEPVNGPGFDSVVNGWLGLLTVWAPVSVCWLAVARVGLRRPEVLLSAAAVTSFAAGDTYYLWRTAGGSSLPFPSLADLGYLSVYPLLLAALVIVMRRQVRLLASPVWLDGAVGSLGAAAVLAVLLGPVLASAAVGPVSLATAVAVASPFFDLMLVAAFAGIAALGEVWMGRRWNMLAAGLLVFAATDVVYGLQVTANTYRLGMPLDAGWAIGLALMAMWVDAVAQNRYQPVSNIRPSSDIRPLAVASAATLAGVAVLAVGTRVPVSSLAVGLAGVTLLAALVRSMLAFLRLARMSDLRRLAAATDELTGLPNRRALYAEGAARLDAPLHRRQALLMMDLDKFKEVNDSLGHRAGDQLLVQVGARLGENLPRGDLLARLGGDEFAVLLDDAGRHEAIEVAIKLRACLNEPFSLENIALYSSISIGIAVFPDDGPDLSTMLRKADIAMYRAKTTRTGHHVYCKADDADDSNRLQVVQELLTALNNDQLVLHYQPKVDLLTGQVRAVEALVFWDHPIRGLLHSDAFLPQVEESGLMPSLTQIVLAKALDQAAAWQAAGQQLTVAVNLSASSLVDPDLPRQVDAMLAARGVSPTALQLEITEEFLMADRDRARSILTRLRHRGIQISVDDFGTGYNSLSYLRDLPIDELKLDRSFITLMDKDDRTAALVASTIDLAHSLGLRMVAAGVETERVYTELGNLGCDQAQGFHLSNPVPAAELDRWLGSRRTPELSLIAAESPFPGRQSGHIPDEQRTPAPC